MCISYVSKISNHHNPLKKMRSTGAIVLIVIVLILAFGGCAGIGTYNRLVGLDESVENSWGNVQTQYQRRADLIPNLVNTVKGAANF